VEEDNIGDDININEDAVGEDNVSNKEEDIAINKDEVIVDNVFNKIVMLKIVSITTSIKVVKVKLNVINVINVEISNTHLTMLVYNSITIKPSAFANPPLIYALK
jgi:hypothetical protein